MTELAPIGCVDDPHKPVWGASGVLPPSTEAAVIDAESGVALGAGELGELLIRGPQVMKGCSSSSRLYAFLMTPTSCTHEAPNPCAR